MACKTPWTREEGMDSMWWTVVNTMSGRGTPRNWEKFGGGFDERGAARPGRTPSRQDFGEAWKFNYDEVFDGGKGQDAYPHPEGNSKRRPDGNADSAQPRIPLEYLEKLFVPRVGEVLETLIVYRWPDQIFPDSRVAPAAF